MARTMGRVRGLAAAFDGRPVAAFEHRGGIRERGDAKKAYSALVKKALGGLGPKAFPADQMPRAVERWILEAVEAGEPASLLE